MAPKPFDKLALVTQCKICPVEIKMTRTREQAKYTRNREDIVRCMQESKEDLARFRAQDMISMDRRFEVYKYLETCVERVSSNVNLVEPGQPCPELIKESVQVVLICSVHLNFPSLTAIAGLLQELYGQRFVAETMLYCSLFAGPSAARVQDGAAAAPAASAAPAKKDKKKAPEVLTMVLPELDLGYLPCKVASILMTKAPDDDAADLYIQQTVLENDTQTGDVVFGNAGAGPVSGGAGLAQQQGPALIIVPQPRPAPTAQAPAQPPQIGLLAYPTTGRNADPALGIPMPLPAQAQGPAPAGVAQTPDNVLLRNLLTKLDNL